MTDSLHSGWRRERFGPFAGLSGWQAGAVLLVWLPPLPAIGRGRWESAAALAAMSVLVTGLLVVPVRHRPAIRWLVEATVFLWARARGWSTFRMGILQDGTAGDLTQPDLPGVAAGLRFHTGPPVGDCGSVCVIHNPAADTWAATARLTHPGLGNADAATRDGYAAHLGGLLAAAAAGEQIARISIQVRTIPDDGARRAAWVADHDGPDNPAVPAAVRACSEQLETLMRTTSIRQELFVTVAAAEQRIRRAAKESGGGVAGRSRVLVRHLGEVEQQLRGLGVTEVAWLATSDLAATIRTGYNPADALPLQRAREEAARGLPTVLGPPLAAAGPVNAAPPAPRSYTHDAFTTISYALLLPELPTRVGSLTRLLAVTAPGERRTLSLHYEPRRPLDGPHDRSNTTCGRPRSAATCAPNAASGSPDATTAAPSKPPPTKPSSHPGTPWSGSPAPPPSPSHHTWTPKTTPPPSRPTPAPAATPCCASTWPRTPASSPPHSPSESA